MGGERERDGEELNEENRKRELQPGAEDSGEKGDS